MHRVSNLHRGNNATRFQDKKIPEQAGGPPQTKDKGKEKITKTEMDAVRVGPSKPTYNTDHEGSENEANLTQKEVLL